MGELTNKFRKSNSRVIFSPVNFQCYRPCSHRSCRRRNFTYHQKAMLRRQYPGINSAALKLAQYGRDIRSATDVVYNNLLLTDIRSAIYSVRTKSFATIKATGGSGLHQANVVQTKVSTVRNLQCAHNWFPVKKQHHSCVVGLPSTIGGARSYTTTKRVANDGFGGYAAQRNADTITLATVANICAQEPYLKEVQYKKPKSWFTKLPQDRVTRLRVLGVPGTASTGGSCVELLVLPQGEQELAWPSFREEKQVNALGRHIILIKGSLLRTRADYVDTHEHKVEEAVGDRSDNIVDLLLRGRSAALLGPAGIGKTTELNSVLIPLFRALLDNDTPLQHMFQRIGGVLYHYWVENDAIKCAEISAVGESLKALSEFFKIYKRNRQWRLLPRNDKVMLLELTESERDPTFTHIPTAVTLSTEQREDRAVVTFHKADVLSYVYRPPHTEGELLVLATALYQEHGQEFCAKLGLPATSTVAAVRRAVRQRVRAIGPLAREVLGSCHQYADRLQEALDLAEAAARAKGQRKFT